MQLRKSLKQSCQQLLVAKSGQVSKDINVSTAIIAADTFLFMADEIESGSQRVCTLSRRGEARFVTPKHRSKHAVLRSRQYRPLREHTSA
jgi:hypothetical protein